MLKKIISLSFLMILMSFNSRNEAVLKFEKLLENHFQSYKTNQREKLTKLGGGWVKEHYSLDGEYKYDVQTTNSLITPYTGTCEFNLKRQYTKFHQTKDEAQNDFDFVNSDLKLHNHFYSYTKEKWIISKRENEGYKKWYNCNEKILDGENKDSENINGCWEENF